jgi:hypothetical protein
VKVEAGHYRVRRLPGLCVPDLRDGRAIPYKASIKVALGSVVLSLRDDSPEASD